MMYQQADPYLMHWEEGKNMNNSLKNPFELPAMVTAEDMKEREKQLESKRELLKPEDKKEIPARPYSREKLNWQLIKMGAALQLEKQKGRHGETFRRTQGDQKDARRTR